jgi:hypothetical protein
VLYKIFKTDIEPVNFGYHTVLSHSSDIKKQFPSCLEFTSFVIGQFLLGILTLLGDLTFNCGPKKVLYNRHHIILSVPMAKEKKCFITPTTSGSGVSLLSD